MKPQVALVGAVAALAAAALLSAGLAGPSKDGAATVRVGQSKLDRILVEGRGRSLYPFEKDKRGKSSCYGAARSPGLR